MPDAEWAGVEGTSPAGIIAVRDVPHWLFPPMAAVVHHGGSGTTHTGLRAGRPTIVVPFFSDQPFWARRVHALGARRLPSRVGSSLPTDLLQPCDALEDDRISEAAAAVGLRLRDENAVARAVAFFDGVVG